MHIVPDVWCDGCFKFHVVQSPNGSPLLERATLSRHCRIRVGIEKEFLLIDIDSPLLLSVRCHFELCSIRGDGVTTVRQFDVRHGFMAREPVA